MEIVTFCIGRYLRGLNYFRVMVFILVYVQLYEADMFDSARVSSVELAYVENCELWVLYHQIFEISCREHCVDILFTEILD